MARSQILGPDTLKKRPHPFRRALLRGLGVVMPPLLTIVILLWVCSTVQEKVLTPSVNFVSWCVVWGFYADNIYDTPPGDAEPGEFVEYEDKMYARLTSNQYVLQEVVDEVRNRLGAESVPDSGWGMYQRWVRIEWLPQWIVVPVFLGGFMILLTLVGRFLAAGVGRIMFNTFEQLIHRLPLVRIVYSSVKQVTDFVFEEREIEFTRVIAVEYPRKGLWSLGFVTGESMLEISATANEPVLSVLMPTSPMPLTGFTITIKKSEALDLDITIDQAIQFIVSCGVVVPPQQIQKAVEKADDAEASKATTVGKEDVSPPVLNSPTDKPPSQESLK